MKQPISSTEKQVATVMGESVRIVAQIDRSYSPGGANVHAI